MTTARQIALHLRQVFFGGNWTASNLRDQITDVSWEEALRQHDGFNTIATLFCHVNYYLPTIIKVLEGGALEGSDKESFKHPEITSEQDWKEIQTKAWEDAEKLIGLIEALPDERLPDHFTHEKYGSYSRNLMGLVEHTHYHLGQIALLKRLVQI